MKTTTYTCDKCGHSQTESNDLFFVAIGVKKLGAYVGSYTRQDGFDDHLAAMWCRACVERAGLAQRIVTKQEPQPQPAPTLEDIIRDICYDMVSDAVREGR